MRTQSVPRRDEPRGTGRQGTGRELFGSRRRGVAVVVGMVREKAPRLSRETAGGHETPARSPTFRLTAGLTAGSDAPAEPATPCAHPRPPPPPAQRAPATHLLLSTLRLPAGLSACLTVVLLLSPPAPCLRPSLPRSPFLVKTPILTRDATQPAPVAADRRAPFRRALATCRPPPRNVR